MTRGQSSGPPTGTGRPGGGSCLSGPPEGERGRGREEGVYNAVYNNNIKEANSNVQC